MNNHAWEKLFTLALKQLDSAKIPKKSWDFGGGTVLMHKFNHRHSKDIDIFLYDPQLLNALSPRINDELEPHLKTYSEQSNFIRLTLAEGEIDFIVTKQISDCKPDFLKVADTFVFVENPIEIIAKKMHYRCEDFTPRDVFDLATVYNARPQDMKRNAYVFAEKIDIVTKRIVDLNTSGILQQGLDNINVLPGGEKIKGQEFNLAMECLEALSKNIDKNQNKNKGVGL